MGRGLEIIAEAKSRNTYVNKSMPDYRRDFLSTFLDQIDANRNATVNNELISIYRIHSSKFEQNISVFNFSPRIITVCCAKGVGWQMYLFVFLVSGALMRQSCHRLLEHQQTGGEEPPLYSPIDQISGETLFTLYILVSAFMSVNF